MPFGVDALMTQVDWKKHQGRVRALHLPFEPCHWVYDLRSHNRAKRCCTWLSHTHQVTGHEFLEGFVLRIHLPVSPNFWGYNPETKTQELRTKLPQRCVIEPEIKPKATSWKGTRDDICHLGWGQLAWEDTHLGNSISLAQVFFLWSNVTADCSAISHLSFWVPKSQ